MNLKLFLSHGEIYRFEEKLKKYSGEINKGFEYDRNLIMILLIVAICTTVKTYRAKVMRFFLQNVQNDILKILKMFKNNMKFT